MNDQAERLTDQLRIDLGPIDRVTTIGDPFEKSERTLHRRPERQLRQRPVPDEHIAGAKALSRRRPDV
jgi:hypothetical protein